ncbi:MAG: collagen binding domain-containing protein, partial [Candidatus Limivicinus sp.]
MPETESTEAAESPSETGIASEEEISDDLPMQALSDSSDISLMSIDSTQNSIMLFDYADNGNYTTVLNSQVACAYKPNGTGSTQTAYIKNMGWHFARYGGAAYADDPLYCIEPYRSYAASTSGNSVDRGVTLDGSGSTSGSNVWYALPAERREAIGLILLYSDQMWDHSISVTTTSKDNNPNVPLRIATQFLIYEIVCGLRDPNTFTLNSVNECGTAGDIFYNAGVASVSNFAPNYNTLVSYVQAAKKIPSFTSASSGSAPTITLSGTSTSVTDSNGVLSNFAFTNGSGASFSKSGNTLTITQTGTISESTVFTATRYLPSAARSTYNIWYMTGSSYQTTISLYNASSSNLNAYFKLKAVPQVGNISLMKTTEDGKNLSGWQFGIYANSACTSLVSGPHTTDSSGKISVIGLSAGTYYVKELGHSDSAINALYYCSSTNPQPVTVTAGATATVSFTNKLNKGSVKLMKATNTGQNLSGWQIGLYSDAGCTNAVTGSPFTTGTDGSVTVTGVTPGTYYAKEVAVNDPYWVCDSTVKTVTVTANAMATVTFTNTHYGDLRIQKNAVNGSAEGWSFQILDADKNILSTVITGADGYAYSGKLLPGNYYVREVHDRDDTYWEYDATVEKQVTVTAGSQAEVSYTNTQYGRIEFQKTTNTGNHLEGWTFRVK